MPAAGALLVTGATGFVGGRIAAALVRRGAPVVALVRRDADRARLAVGGDIDVVCADYHDGPAVRAALAEAEASTLVHAAWELAPGSAYLDSPSNPNDLCASLALLGVARDLGYRRVVGIGTCLEYEQSECAAPETTALRPRTVYGASKASVYLLGEAWARLGAFEFAWTRLYHPFGPREPERRLVPSVVRSLLAGERVATTSGLQRRSFMHVDDVGDAVAAVVLSDACGPFNVGASDVVSVRDLVEKLAEAVGRPELLDIGALDSRRDEPLVLWPDISRLREEIGWTPSLSLASAIADTVAWWRSVAAGQQ